MLIYHFHSYHKNKKPIELYVFRINLKEIVPMDLFIEKSYFLSYLLILNPFILFANEPISLKN